MKVRLLSVLVTLFFCLISLPSHAQQEMVDQPEWAGSINLGYIETSGNSKAQTLNFSLDFGKDGILWRHALHMEAYNQSTDEDRNAERYLGSWQSNRKIGEQQSVFFRSQYDEDKFSNYAAQGSLIVGYSNRVVNNDVVILDLDAGPGYRRSKVADTGAIENEIVVRLAGNFKWNISDTSAFGQTLSVEDGNENTVARSSSSITMAVYEMLSLKVGYNLKWTRSVTPGTDNWDRETQISVVFSW